MLIYDIASFGYSPAELRRNLKKEDFWKYQIPKDSVEELTSQISKDFANSNEQPRNILKTSIISKPVFTTGSLYDALTIRQSNAILKKILCITQTSRSDEINQIWKVIENEGPSSFVFRTDVSSFFEMLPFREIVESLFSENLIPKTVYSHLIQLANKIQRYGYTGLPRGLSISSSLSEFAMQCFDKEIRKIEGVVYYSRYVDDIVLISSRRLENLAKKIENLMPFNLKLNRKKTWYEEIGSNRSIDFLGFSFDLKDLKKTKIASSKIGKLKKRIMLSLKSYLLKDQEFNLLFDRIKFLSGNSKLKKASRQKPIIVGLSYQYSICDHQVICRQLKTIDTFFRSLLKSKRFNFSQSLRAKLTNAQISKLERLSFSAGYKSKITHPLSRKRVSEIKRAWRYE